MGFGDHRHNDPGMNDLVSPQPSRPPRAGDRFEPRELVALAGRVQVPDPIRVVHLQFRRFAGCPICCLHLRSFAARHDEIVAAGVVEVAVFYSPAEDLRKVHTQLPFAVVPDPERRLYAEFGVGSSSRALLDPRAWVAIVRGIASGASSDPSAGQSDGSFGLPADFLVASSGRVLARKYGRYADDQWSVDELLALVREHAETR